MGESRHIVVNVVVVRYVNTVDGIHYAKSVEVSVSAHTEERSIDARSAEV